jgi:hypothetical protein
MGLRFLLRVEEGGPSEDKDGGSECEEGLGI